MVTRRAIAILHSAVVAAVVMSGCGPSKPKTYPAGTLVGQHALVTVPSELEMFEEDAGQSPRLVVRPYRSREFICIYDKVTFIRKSRARDAVQGWCDRRKQTAGGVQPVTENELSSATFYSYSYNAVVKGVPKKYVSGLLVLPGGKALTIWGALYLKGSTLSAKWDSILEGCDTVF